MKIKCEMAGTLLEVKVKKGDKLTAGQEVAVIESMKMEVPIASPANGTVASVLKNAGDFVNEGDVLVELA